MITSLEQQLIRDENSCRYPYTDTVGKITIGVGRNLTDEGLSSDEINYLLQNDIKNKTSQLEQTFPWVVVLDDIRKAAVINMAFNLGIHGIAEFRNFLDFLQAGRYEDAATAMLDSKWAIQVGARAQRLALQIKTGVWQ